MTLLAASLVLVAVSGRLLGVGERDVAVGNEGGRLVGFAGRAPSPPAADPPDAGRSDFGRRAAPSAAIPTDCADLLVLGMDGNGEQPRRSDTFGRTLHLVERAWQRSADAVGRTLAVRRVGPETSPPRDLVALPGRPADEAVGPRRAKAWRAAVPAGVRAARTVLEREAERCPEQPVALVGYAQGAAVAHRLVERFRKRGELDRLVGALLVSDPERRARSAAGRTLGTPAADPSGEGILTRLLRPRPDVPPGTEIFAVWQVCTAGDLVCDPRATRVRVAQQRARGYRYGAGARQVRQATRALHRLSLLRPVPQPAVQVVEAGVGEPVSRRLGVQVAAAAADGVRWQAEGELPDGLSLDADGMLSGAVDQQGAWRIPVTVRGTEPATPPAGGTLTVVVRAEATSTSAGGQVSCETRSDGTAWCWGRNNWGQLGNGTPSGPRALPVQVDASADEEAPQDPDSPQPPEPWDDWTSIETSGATTCGIRTEGSLWCWGLNHDGQLGVDGRFRALPVQVGSALSWTSVSTGWFHTCGTRGNGTLWCWGLGGRGQLGLGSTESRRRPIRVGDARDWDSVSVGGWYTCGTRTGTVWCWGQNDQGQLGLGGPGLRLRPTQVGTGADWVSLSASWAHTCATTRPGQAWCWGLNDSGQLGDGTRASRRVPTRVTGGGSWTRLSTGDAATCGVDDTGGGWCWGSDRYRQLGGDTTGDSLEPTRVVAEQPWADVDAGWFHACGRFREGPTACWGNNEQGQVGDGTLKDDPLPKEVG